MGHGVACVDGQVHEYLLHLAGVDLCQPEVGGQARLQADVLPQCAAQQRLHAEYQLVRIDDLGLHRFFAAEQQQLSDQTNGAVPCLADPLDVVRSRAPGLEVFSQEVGVVDNHRQEV